MKTITKTLAASLLATFCLTAGQAALLTWSFPGTWDETTDNVMQTSKDGGMADSFLVRGAGLNPDPNNSSADGPFTSKAQGADNEQQYTTDIDQAMTWGQYVSFTVENSGADPFTIDSVDVNNFYSRSASPFKFEFFLFSDIDGFTSGNELAGTSSYGGNISFDATGNASYQNLTGPVEFRILTTGTEGNNYIEHGFGTKGGADDVVVSGAVIPEPGTLVLVGIALAGFLVSKKFRCS